MARVRAEVKENSTNGVTIFSIRSRKESKVINKEEMRNMWASLRNGYRSPLEGVNLRGNPSRKEFHVKNKEIGGMGTPYLMPLVGLKGVVFPPLTRMEMEEDEMQEMMSFIRFGGKLKKNRACLIKDHSSLSKAYSKLIFRSMLNFLPFILEK